MATNENLPPNVIKQLAKELKNLDETPPDGIKVVINEDNLSTIFADIEGPAETPYENGVFRMKLILSHDFPRSPPKGYFVTKIFHPNVSSSGEICVNTLKKDWNESLGLRHVLLVVRCLLIEPFPESALNEQAGKLLLDNYEEYARRARIHTGVHAIKLKSKSKTGAISESTTALNVDNTNIVSSATVPPPSPLVASATTSKGGPSFSDNSLAVGGGGTETGIALQLIMQKKLAAAAKTLPDKKKIDARKKSLKRL